MIATIVPLLVILLTGVVFRYIPGIPSVTSLRAGIGSIVLHVFLPALVIRVLSKTEIDSTLFTIPVTSLCCIIGCLIAAHAVYKLLGSNLTKPQIGALILASVWCNATYLGLPIVTGYIGAHASKVPIVFDVMAMSPMLFIVGALIGRKFGRHSSTQCTSDHIRQIITSPPLLAVVVGLLINALHIPIHPSLDAAMEIMGRAVSPLMIFSVGLALQPLQLRRLPYIIPAVVIKLVLATAIGYGISYVLMDNGDIRNATILESAMPTMMLTMVYAERYGLDTSILAETIFVTTMASMITLPFLASLL